VTFLSQPDSYGPQIERIDRITTHISHLFLVGGRVYKLKRAVKLPYVDFSTLDSRRIACEREVSLNRHTAPDLYERTLAITKNAHGKLMFGGEGEVVDWVVVMRRFEKDCLLDDLARRGPLRPEVLKALGDVIAEFHARAEPGQGYGGASAMRAIIDGNSVSFAACQGHVFEKDSIDRLQRVCYEQLERISPLLDARRRTGKVRVCHGDLHLRNICLIDGHPVLFDCIEFSDSLSNIDILYDLAFLLMDFAHRGLKGDANAVFNRYLDRSDEDGGLAALPLFLAIRAAIRAHVIASSGDVSDGIAEARSYVRLALELLQPKASRLIAIGGLSGTGKSTLAYRLAPDFGQTPGARVLRSDVVRKQLFGEHPETRLPAEGYDRTVTRRVYDRLAIDAEKLLLSGQTVIVDAVYARPDERDAIKAVAEKAAVQFTGIWLEGDTEILAHRVSGRRNDASDADISIVRRQADYDIGPIDWYRIDASSPAADVAAAVNRKIR